MYTIYTYEELLLVLWQRICLLISLWFSMMRWIIFQALLVRARCENDNVGDGNKWLCNGFVDRQTNHKTKTTQIQNKTHTDAHRHTHTHTRMHAHTHPHIHTHAHTHTRTRWRWNSEYVVSSTWFQTLLAFFLFCSWGRKCHSPQARKRNNNKKMQGQLNFWNHCCQDWVWNTNDRLPLLLDLEFSDC